MGLVYNRMDDLIELLKDKKQLSFIAGMSCPSVLN